MKTTSSRRRFFSSFYHVAARINLSSSHKLPTGGDGMKLATLMGFGVGMATTLIAAKAVSSGDVKSRTKAIRKKIVSLLD